MKGRQHPIGLAKPIIKVVQTPTFKKNIKKQHANQKKDVDEAVKALMASLLIGRHSVAQI